MGFLILHSRNRFCGEDPVIVNSEHILSVSPMRGGPKKWSLDTNGAHIELTTGSEFDVTEHWDAVMGMLREAQVGSKGIPGTGPFLKIDNQS